MSNGFTWPLYKNKKQCGFWFCNVLLAWKYFHSFFRPHKKVPFFSFKFLVCGSLSMYTEVHPSKRLVGRLYFTFMVPQFVSFSSSFNCIETCFFLFLSGHCVFVHVYSYSVGHHCLFYLQSNPPYSLQNIKTNARFFQKHNSKFPLFQMSDFPGALWNHAINPFVL